MYIKISTTYNVFPSRRAILFWWAVHISIFHLYLHKESVVVMLKHMYNDIFML